MTKEKYYPQLDGIRAIAIGTVLIGHFTTFNPLLVLVAWGDSGVILFFCLSGFLITGILLRNKFNESSPRLENFKIFYARRALRIFPVYYLTVFFLFFINYLPVRENFIRLVSYSVNYVPFLPNLRSSLEAASHFWSLCVEEQFYLIWPFMILFIRPRYLHALVIFIIISSVGFKIIAALSGLPYQQIFRPVYGCMDSLGLGALLSLYCREQGKYALCRSRLSFLGLFFGIPGIAIITLFRTFLHIDDMYRSWEWLGVIYFLCLALSSCVLIEFAARNTSSAFGKFLGSRPMIHIGKISYGIYVYHFFTPVLVGYVQHKVFLTLNETLAMLLKFLLSFLIAQASWMLLERPVQRLKSYFQYGTAKN